MSAYTAVVYLEQLLIQLMNSDQFPKEEVVSLREKIFSLKYSLEKIFPAPKKYRDEANKLAFQIREQIFEVQDTIESFIFFTQNHPPESPESSKGQSSTSISLREIAAGIDPFINEANKLSDAVKEAPGYSQSVDEYKNYKYSVFGQKNKIIGQDKYKRLIQEELLAETGSRLVIPICGMPGIGKTTLAKSIYEDVNFMKGNFPYKAWVTISHDAIVHDVLGKLLNTLESRGQKAGDKKYEGDEAKLEVELYQALSNNKYLVVIDDLWDLDFWMRLQVALPDNDNNSRILLTTRMIDVAKFVNPDFSLKIEPLNFRDSWTFLSNWVFGDDNACPRELENLGRRIASDCNGHPLSLVVIGGILSQVPKEADYWQIVSEDTHVATSDSMVEEAYLGTMSLSYDSLPCQLKGIMSLSYDYLPCQLKGCFLYMGAFPKDSDIPVSKLIMLWVAEGFFTTRSEMSLEKVAEKSLLDLIDRSLVVIRRKGSDGRIKACGIHSSLSDLAEKESHNDRFFHSRKRYLQKQDDGINIQRRISIHKNRRISIHKNILMCLADVYYCTKEIINPRSLLYVGTHHHHPMPFTLTFDLLRVLDAYTVFFIQFPDEILKLILLRYLSFTFNGKLPSRLSRLQRLQVLIVKRQPKYIYPGSSFLPDEIWNMKELRHLIITETDLPPLLSPTEPGSVLFETLQTLSNVNAVSCTQEVLENMPNLKKLSMWVVAPGKVGLYLNKLDQLEVFKFVVLEPVPGKMIEFRQNLFFPDTVRKLCLSGCGLPWADMEVIAKLPNLEVLKLKELAFHGEEWCPAYSFMKLKLLVIEYLNLKRWLAGPSLFPFLGKLILRHCYQLEELPYDIAGSDSLGVIKLVHCSTKAVEWAEEIIGMVEEYGYENPQIHIQSSWEEISPYSMPASARKCSICKETAS